MLQFLGSYFNGEDSQSRPAQITIEAECVRISFATEKLGLEFPKNRVVASQRLAGTTGSIRLNNSARFMFNSGEDFDAFYHKLFGRKNWLTSLESHRNAILVGVLSLFFVLAIFMKFIIPASAKSLSSQIPVEVSEFVSRSLLKALQDLKFLTVVEGSKDQDHLEDLLEQIKFRTGERLKLVIATGKDPNAFALPDGTIVITEELIDLAEDDQELLGVLFHEAGHVRYHHGWQMLLSSGAITLVLGPVFGGADFSQLALALVYNGYSRDFEREADAFAKTHMNELGISPQKLGSILERMTVKARSVDPGWLSTHPSTKERIEYLNAL